MPQAFSPVKASLERGGYVFRPLRFIGNPSVEICNTSAFELSSNERLVALAPVVTAAFSPHNGATSSASTSVKGKGAIFSGRR
jgi:hypothetical protein